MITPADGKMMNLFDIEDKYDREWEVALEKQEGRFIAVKNGNPQGQDLD